MQDEFAARIKNLVLEEMDFSRELGDEEVMEIISRVVSRELKGENYALLERINLEKTIFNSLRRLDILQELVERPDVTEIMVNGPDNIFFEKEGQIYRFHGRFSSSEKMDDMIQQIVSRHNRVINQASPIVDTRLEDGSRVNIVLSPISIDGSAISIRKFPEKPMDMGQLISKGSISKDASIFLERLVRAKYSIFISGGTGSGKTTFLNALSQYIPEDERIITIEDSAELQLQSAKNIVRLETRNANTEGVRPVTIRDLIRTALRMRPDRIIVGECRGAEALDMLTAMITGHEGSLSTGHSNSCRDMLSRIETMVIMGQEIPLAAVRQQIASGIDILVQLGRMKDKSRKVLEIVEIDGIEEGEICTNVIYRRNFSTGNLDKVGELKNKEKLSIAEL